jgi:hypothetical protein
LNQYGSPVDTGTAQKLYAQLLFAFKASFKEEDGVSVKLGKSEILGLAKCLRQGERPPNAPEDLWKEVTGVTYDQGDLYDQRSGQAKDEFLRLQKEKRAAKRTKAKANKFAKQGTSRATVGNNSTQALQSIAEGKEDEVAEIEALGDRQGQDQNDLPRYELYEEEGQTAADAAERKDRKRGPPGSGLSPPNSKARQSGSPEGDTEMSEGMLDESML